MQPLVLQGAEEALRHGVVVAVVLATHARRHAEGGEALAVRETTVLRALICMMNEAGGDPTLYHRHRRHTLQGLGDHGTNFSCLLIEIGFGGHHWELQLTKPSTTPPGDLFNPTSPLMDLLLFVGFLFLSV